MVSRVGMILILCSGAFAQTMSVCEALEHLDDLNEKQVSIRGVFGASDTGQILLAIPPCSQPTLRDAWSWRDIIAIYPAQRGTVSTSFLDQYQKIRKAHPDTKILATLSGRLETRSRFEIRDLPAGGREPIGFGNFVYYVAALHYIKADDLQYMPFGPGEQEELAKIQRRPWPILAR
jgi:hypothetical protein